MKKCYFALLHRAKSFFFEDIYSIDDVHNKLKYKYNKKIGENDSEIMPEDLKRYSRLNNWFIFKKTKD